MFIVAAVSFTEGIAQENVSIGPIVGVNFSKLAGNTIYNDWKTGATAGISINCSGKDRFGVNGQILVSRMGGAVSLT